MRGIIRGFIAGAVLTGIIFGYANAWSKPDKLEIVIHDTSAGYDIEYFPPEYEEGV